MSLQVLANAVGVPEPFGDAGALSEAPDTVHERQSCHPERSHEGIQHLLDPLLEEGVEFLRAGHREEPPVSLELVVGDLDAHLAVVSCALQAAVVPLLAFAEQCEEIVVEDLVAAQVDQLWPVGVGMAEVG